MSLTIPNKPAGSEGGENRIERLTMALLDHHGFRYADDPMEYGQDAYDITNDMRTEVIVLLNALGDHRPPMLEAEIDAREKIIASLRAENAALASTAGAGAGDPVKEACKPWQYGVGDPPDYESPLTGPYSAGVTYAIQQLADLTEAGDYVSADGSETFENDVRGTILNVLKAANIYDDEEGRLASLSHGITVKGAKAQGFVVANVHDDERQRFRAWGQFGPMWTANRTEALYFARRIDAERFCAEDEDAWRILLSAAPASPISTGEDEGRRAIRFAMGLEDHWDRFEFLNAFMGGDLSEWPEFASASPPAPAEHGVEIRELSKLADDFDRSGKTLHYPEQYPPGYVQGWEEAHRYCARDLRTLAESLKTGGQGAGREGEGRDPSGPGSREPSPSVSAYGFDPSRASEALQRLRIIAARGAEVNHLDFRNEAGEWIAASTWIEVAIDMLSQACKLLPALKEERDFWRSDLSARLWMLTALHQSASERGEHKRAADLGVHIRSNIASYEAAEAKEWHPRCDVCGGFVRPNEASISGEEISGHARCVAEEAMGSIWPHGEGELARRVRLAKAIADAPDEVPPAPVDRSPAGAETHSGSVGDESAVTGAAGQAPSVPSPTDAKTGEV
jgi:hypothetical protein